ncbi:hypothetical protein SGLAD_v1c05250 [Spiroplasma gladiatoris]|uniref:Transmembrane protein n=1 Tax=Spiroplasma gladiatoris TaxID=2143 RepID=A0A4P7AH14_9MOLU|nr:hypothetical protein [Spiroplasma gladiatoris]QBQ07724.1 hypothetical protein SGLAD_v1c05250 [Spiroplasma gladiatoris]
MLSKIKIGVLLICYSVCLIVGVTLTLLKYFNHMEIYKLFTWFHLIFILILIAGAFYILIEQSIKNTTRTLTYGIVYCIVEAIISIIILFTWLVSVYFFIIDFNTIWIDVATILITILLGIVGIVYLIMLIPLLICDD